MTNVIQRSYWRVNTIIVPLLFIGGTLAFLLGIFGLAVKWVGVMAGLCLLFGGGGAIAMAQLLTLLINIADHLAAMREQSQVLKLLVDIEDHLATMREQMGKGVFGLFGDGR